ncbi:chemotaxis protein CheA [Acetatifactor muris]|jgi:two-component system chemotaxis sensor kinase CheA|uniref:Chemotaxis protein CheA n=1 Tax=Acetatifactor muris TaxID=879566 RepID=A0A2K4ZEZ8_9FIRM|nr:chemotaxis protein CheA [Acetatifactor muris]MCI8800683.1 chemotaxis protein CheA [Lachnospiraceae bacterium]MCR2047237.1 chemotaxis protein CheA [Acetatifactor muris]SOY29042.1 Chemotaxis protein CheA [Acetatifactor muris]
MAEDFNTESMLDMYLFENGQLLEQLQETVLEQKDADCFDEDSINEIFRTMHTIKGSSGIMMFDNITAVSHKLEDIFFYLRESHPDNVPHVELVEHVLEVEDFISNEMEKIRNGDPVDGDASNIIADLDKFLNMIKNGGEAEAAAENVHEEPKHFYIAPVATSASRFYKIFITFFPETEMSNVHAYKAVYALKEIAEDILYSPEDILTDEKSSEKILKDGFRILLQAQCSEEEVREIIGVGYDIEKVEVYECDANQFLLGFDFGDQAPAPQIDLESSVEVIEARQEEAEKGKAEADAKSPEKPKIIPGDFVIQSKEPGKQKKLAKDKPKGEKASFISVNVSKMDQLMDLIGELVISESVVLQSSDLKVPGLNLDNFNKAAAQLASISTDLQNVIMSMRMVPLTNTFQKMNRIVFDVSRKLGKDIEFVMVGETTEVDKNIIEHISDPLMHLVRNAVDHGIETNEERAESGKPDKGKVTLSARTEAGKVWISVEDNGTGLDREKILAKARKQGILDDSKPDSAYTDKEVYQFITLPGFSTNEQVTEYSGRGVGMDVVVQNIQAIGGALEIESTPGSGSVMSLKIPLTLAIIDGIVMEVGNSSFVMETGVIKQFIRVKEDMMIHEPNGDEFVMIRGDCFPVIRLGRWYGLEEYQESVEDGVMLILEVEDRKICLLVDKLIGEQEIVVKPIPSYIKKVRGLSGCTQLGDGSIALILDAPGLVE